MNHSDDIERFANDPERLVALCRDVFNRLDLNAGNGEKRAMEAQLREISRSISNLDKMRVPVPDTLRAEKTRLAAALGTMSDNNRALADLVRAFEEILEDVKAQIEPDGTPKRNPSVKIRRKRSATPKTDKNTLREFILTSLKQMGGKGHVSLILDDIETRFKHRFVPGDFEIRQDGRTPAWKNNVQWERFRMVDHAGQPGHRRQTHDSFHPCY